MSVDRLRKPRSLRPQVRPKFLWEQIRLSVQAYNNQPSSKARNGAPEKIVLRQGLQPTNKSVVKARHDPFSPCPLSYSNPCITSVYASHLLRWTNWKTFEVEASVLVDKSMIQEIGLFLIVFHSVLSASTKWGNSC